MSLENKRATQDLQNRQVVNLPDAAGSATTPSIDLATTTGHRIPNVELRVYVPATPDLVEAKDITLTVEDSADDVTFAAVADLPAQTITGAAEAAGGDELDKRFKLPIGLRRYVRLKAEVEAAGGDSSDVTAEIGLVF